jgi:hypothetical protein
MCHGLAKGAESSKAGFPLLKAMHRLGGLRMKRDDKLTSGVESADRPALFGARRRLLRGSFAAPAVLALHSGSAVAASSSMNRLNQELTRNSTTSPPYSMQPSDTFVRTRLSSLRPSAGSTEVRWYINGAEIDALRANKKIVNGFLKPSEWWQFDPSTGTTVGAKLSGTPRWSADVLGVWAADGGSVAVRFTTDKSYVTISSVTGCSWGGGSPATLSVWTSFVTSA